MQIELPELELISPNDNATNQSTQIELNWEKIKGAQKYELQLSESQDFNTAFVDSTITGTSYQTSELDRGTTYFWHVKPVKENYGGPVLKWSETWEFTTAEGETEPVTVELKTPTDGEQLDTTSPTFDWTSVSESTEYHYQLSTDQDFSDVLEDTVVDTSGVQIPGLNAGTQYYWRVSPILDSATGTWSEVFGFTTSEAAIDTTAPSAPVPVSPDDGAGNVSLKPTFEWEPVEGADSYILHISYSDEMVSEVETSETSHTPKEDLNPGTTIYWRVRAADDGSKAKSLGDWSDKLTFTTASQASGGSGTSTVTLTSPSDGSTGLSTTLTLSWEALSGISNYQVQLATNGDFSSPVVDQVVANAYHEVSGLNNDQQYYWRVQADGDGDTSNWSSVRDFRTKASTTTTDPSGSVAGDRQALMDLYNATDGDGWKNNSGWGSGDPSDSWHGVKVDANGRVVRLDLWKNGLEGTLPASIGNLTKLTYLNVKGNRLTGDIPSEIGNMTSLEWLILSGRNHLQNGNPVKEPPQDLNEPYHPGKYNSATNDFTILPSTIGDL
ncbi:fibronectin type III domain-containing protein, partial [Aliifodinibius sp. S!AR15-10]|uniref:fibronectin type III domain-containing protein n=1 Tax=Aliifodinibius sp. S!AR15-10 TaxID=2950437 RepID=UPI00285656F0